MAGFWDSLRAAFAGTNAARRRRTPTRHRARAKAVPPAPAFRGRQALRYGPKGKEGTRTRAQLADRYDRNPPGGQAVKMTSSRFPGAVMGHRAFTGNYPARGNLRDVGHQLEGTRSQLAARRAQRAAQGYAATQPNPASGEGARSGVRGVGRARGPARPLPGNLAKSAPVPAARRQPSLSGGIYAGKSRRVG